MTFGLWFLALAVAYVLAIPHPVLAAADLVLVCPGGGSGEPQYRDQRGRALPILNPGERAIAAKLCDLSAPTPSVNVNVSVTNSGTNTIYLAFTDYSTQLPGPITWTSCTVVNNQVVIPGASAAPNNTCSAVVPATAGKTRFCAFTTQVPVGQTPNCNLAQTYNQTIIETNFRECVKRGLLSHQSEQLRVVRHKRDSPELYACGLDYEQLREYRWRFLQSPGLALQPRRTDIYVPGAAEHDALWKRELPEQLR